MRFENRKIIVVLAIVITLAAVLICPVNPARATFPGKNGRISFLEVTDVVNVYTINPDGSDERQLTSFGPDNSVFNSAEWSSDGRQLVFPAGPVTVSGPGQIWVMNADGSNQHILFSDPAGLDLNTIFSPDGNYIVFTRCQGGGFPPCAIYRIRSDGSELTALTNFDPNPDVVDAFPNYSPDGRQIAFTSLTRGGILEAIYVMDSDGSDIRRLTPPAIGASSANWSPDGESIMFDTNDGFCGGCFFPIPKSGRSEPTDETSSALPATPISSTSALPGRRKATPSSSSRTIIVHNFSNLSSQGRRTGHQRHRYP